MLNIQFSMVELQNRCSDQGAATPDINLQIWWKGLPVRALCRLNIVVQVAVSTSDRAIL